LCMYTKGGPGLKRQTVWDPFAGTMSLALACLTHNRKYIGSELDMAVFTSAHQRCSRYITGRLRGSHKLSQPIPLNGGDMDVESARVVTMLMERDLHQIALSMHPPGCDSELTRVGALARYEGRLKIQQVPKEEMMDKQGRTMGEGLYTGVPLKAGKSLDPPLYVYGTLQAISGRTSRMSIGRPVNMRASILEGLVMVPANNCMARWINDSRGSRKKPNVALIERDVNEISAPDGYTLLEVVPTQMIVAGCQLLINNTTTFFCADHPDDPDQVNEKDTDEERRARRVKRNRVATKTGRALEAATSEDEEPDGDDDEAVPDEGDDGAGEGDDGAGEDDDDTDEGDDDGTDSDEDEADDEEEADDDNEALFGDTALTTADREQLQQMITKGAAKRETRANKDAAAAVSKGKGKKRKARDFELDLTKGKKTKKKKKKKSTKPKEVSPPTKKPKQLQTKKKGKSRKPKEKKVAEEKSSRRKKATLPVGCCACGKVHSYTRIM
jgi:hypothetical protein